MIIGMLGGSFCPPTIAHVELSRACIEQNLCDKVIWVPVNDSYQKKTNIGAFHRVNMIALTIEDEPGIAVSLHEICIDKNVYTIDSLKMLQKLHPNDKILFIAGADKMGYRWFCREEMVRDFGYIVTSRDGIDCNQMIEKSDTLSKYRKNIKIVNYESDISSTLARQQIFSTGTSNLVHPSVMQYIKDTNCFG